jgi:hypothetical protein
MMIVLYFIGAGGLLLLLLLACQLVTGQGKLHRKQRLVVFIALAVCALSAISWINAVSYYHLSVGIGGTAAKGKIEDGRFYVGRYGEYTEVSSDLWHLSRLHGRTVLPSGIAFILGCITLRYLSRNSTTREACTIAFGQDVFEAWSQGRTSGELQSKTRCFHKDSE